MPRGRSRIRATNREEGKSRLSVKRVSTAEEAGKVQLFRRQIYRQYSKHVSDRDLRSRSESTIIFMVLADSKLVGTVTTSAPAREEPLVSVDVPLGGYPECLPPKTRVLEVSHLCVAHFRGSMGVLQIMFEEVYKQLVKSARYFLLAASDQRFKQRYIGLSFQPTGIFYEKDGQIIEVMYSKQAVFGLFGLLPSPWRWNQALGHLHFKPPKSRISGEVQRTIFNFHKFCNRSKGLYAMSDVFRRVGCDRRILGITR